MILINISSNLTISSLGAQWFWEFTNLSANYLVKVDHYILDSSILQSLPEYFHYVSQYLLLSIYSSIKFILITIDVIHSLGIYSFGIKLDAIP